MREIDVLTMERDEALGRADEAENHIAVLKAQLELTQRIAEVAMSVADFWRRKAEEWRVCAVLAQTDLAELTDHQSKGRN